MIYEDFLKVTLQLQKEQRRLDKLYENGVDLIEMIDPYHSIISILMKEIYGEEGYDWWAWYCYENNYGQKGLEAFDASKNRICYSHESLWEYLENLKNKNKNA